MPKAKVVKDVLTGPGKKYEYREITIGGTQGWSVNTLWGSRAPLTDLTMNTRGQLVLKLRRPTK